MKKEFPMPLAVLILLATLSFELQAADFSSQEWTLSEERDQVTVYTRGVEGDNNGRAIRAITVVDQSPASVLALVVDYPSAVKWRKQLKSIEKIKQVDDSNWYIRTVSDLPWPLSDRVSTLKCTVDRYPETQSIAYRFDNAEKEMRNEGESEKEKINGVYEFTVMEDGKTQVAFELIISSALKVPDWLIDTMLGSSFVDQLAMLRDVVKEPQYNVNKSHADIH